jgi:hypothetical protein
MFDTPTAKTRLGIADASKDAIIQQVLDMAEAVAESYTGRKFGETTETVKVIPFKGYAIKVYRYPLTSVTSITDSEAVQSFTKFHLDSNAGIIYLDGGAVSHELSVTYKGGYVTFPLDLELALWDIFDAVWASVPGAGLTIGSAATPTAPIKSITVPDVGTVSYDNSAGASSASGAAAGGGYITPNAAFLLDKYRAESVIGVG